MHKDFGRQEKWFCRHVSRKDKEQKEIFLKRLGLSYIKFAGLGCFVLQMGQEDRGVGGRAEQIVSLSSRDGGRLRG